MRITSKMFDFMEAGRRKLSRTQDTTLIICNHDVSVLNKSLHVVKGFDWLSDAV